MRILHLSASDTGGGAALSTYRIHKGLQRLGIDSRMLVQNKITSDVSVEKICPSASIPMRLRAKIRRLARTSQYKPFSSRRRDPFQPFSDDRGEYEVDVSTVEPIPHVVSLYWVGEMLDIGRFFSLLPERLPVIWRLSDMNPFTGGCHYAWDCLRWTTACGACPELGSKREHDLAYKIWSRKLEAYSGKRINIVAPSKWIAKEAKLSALFSDQPITLIPNGVNTAIFRPHAKSDARRSLGIADDSTIVLAGAHHLQDKRKGFDHLVKALEHLRVGKKILLMLVGRGDLQGLDRSTLPTRSLGYIQDDEVLACAYAAADICAIPSLYENLPNMALESLSCGTPVVGFNHGGLADVVLHGKTGLLAHWKDSDDLGLQISYLLSNPDERQRMGHAARELMVKEYSLDIEVKRYIRLYESITSCHASGI